MMHQNDDFIIQFPVASGIEQILFLATKYHNILQNKKIYCIMVKNKGLPDTFKRFICKD